MFVHYTVWRPVDLIPTHLALSGEIVDLANGRKTKKGTERGNKYGRLERQKKAKVKGGRNKKHIVSSSATLFVAITASRV